MSGISTSDLELPDRATVISFAEDPTVIPDLLSVLGYARMVDGVQCRQGSVYSAAGELEAEPKPPLPTPKGGKAKAPRPKAAEKTKELPRS